MLTGKSAWRAGEGRIRSGHYFQCCLILKLILKYKNIFKTDQNLNVFLRNDLPEIMNGTYVINLAEYKLIGGYWIALWIDNESESEYCKSFEAEQIPKKLRKS